MMHKLNVLTRALAIVTIFAFCFGAKPATASLIYDLLVTPSSTATKTFAGSGFMEFDSLALGTLLDFEFTVSAATVPGDDTSSLIGLTYNSPSAFSGPPPTFIQEGNFFTVPMIRLGVGGTSLAELRWFIASEDRTEVMEGVYSFTERGSVIPVPAALPLLMTSLGGLLLIGLRRRKAA